MQKYIPIFDRRYLLLSIIFFLSILIFTCNNNPSQADNHSFALDHENFRSDLQVVFEGKDLMGMTVLLLQDGEIVTQQNFGLRDSMRQLPITDDTYFRVASISKSFTATAIMQLVDQGKLNLDTPVSTYLGWNLVHPKYPDQAITLRHLMSHTSGIRDGEGYGNFVGDMIKKELDIRELFTKKGAYFTDDMFAENEPGTYFSYTNCTWGIVASLVEIASGERFDRYCRRHIFEPLGIGTSYNVLDLDSLENLSILYRYQDDSWTPQTDDFRVDAPQERAYPNYQMGQNGLIYGPQGSVRSSARDLAVFSQMLMNKGKWNGRQILSQGAVRDMIAENYVYNGRNGDTWDNFFLSYGLGIHRLTNRDSADIIFPDRRMVGHPGIAWGLLSDMYFDPQTKSGVVFITNGSKNKYEYGSATTFYQVEEAVFEIAYGYLKTLEGAK